VARILAVLIWPAGIAVIVVTAALLASRVRARPAGPRLGSRVPWLDSYPVTESAGGSRAGIALRQAVRFLVVIAVGAAVVFGVMALVGKLVLHAGPAMDKPIYHWVMAHHVHAWKELMASLTKIGNGWSTRMAAVAAAVCLAVTWRRLRWLPALAFLVLSLLQRYLTHGLHLVDHRVGPPGFPHGTFPSGGSERCVVFFGLIAYFLWREFSGRRETAIWAGAAVAALAFNEGYSRIYLGMHWTTDVLAGWLYGILLLAVFILATRVVMGPARVPAGPVAGEPAAARQAGPAVARTAGAARAGSASAGITGARPAGPASSRTTAMEGPP
jgi:undecaprenyl-diphosphatase